MKNTKLNEMTIKNALHWNCDACGGDSDTGCLMSDFQDCIRG